MEFKTYIEKIRKENGYKRKSDLAKATGISLATISRIESGVHHPGPDTLKKISEHLRTVTYEDLLVAAGYLDHAEEKEMERDPEAEKLLQMLYEMPKEKRDRYIQAIKILIDGKDKTTS